jgi:hypothetical protein
MLGRPSIGVWVTTSLRRDFWLVPMDWAWHPSFNPILNATIKDSSTSPTRLTT